MLPLKVLIIKKLIVIVAKKFNNVAILLHVENQDIELIIVIVRKICFFLRKGRKNALLVTFFCKFAKAIDATSLNY